MKARVEIDASDMLGKLDSLEDRLKNALLELGQIMAQRISSAAKAGRIWTDQTNQARAGLTARAVMRGTVLVISLFHLAPHGIWLEIAMGERYAIIMQTLQRAYPQVVSLMGRLISGS